MVVEVSETYTQLVSKDLLQRMMEAHGWTVRSLADEADYRLRRTHKKRLKSDPTAPQGCKRGVIGHLRSGQRKNVHLHLAKVIAEILKLPTDVLFVTEVSKVHREARNTKELAA